jgi:hypothetical protein
VTCRPESTICTQLRYRTFVRSQRCRVLQVRLVVPHHLSNIIGQRAEILGFEVEVFSVRYLVSSVHQALVDKFVLRFIAGGGDVQRRGSRPVSRAGSSSSMPLSSPKRRSAISARFSKRPWPRAASAMLIKFLGDANLAAPGTGCCSWPVAPVSENSFARRMRIVMPDTARWDGSIRALWRGLVAPRAPDVDQKNCETNPITSAGILAKLA